MKKILKFINGVIDFIKSMLTSNSDASSKRTNGTIGFQSVIVIQFLCFIFNKEAPDITELILIVSATLLGLGLMEGIYKKGGKK